MSGGFKPQHDGVSDGVSLGKESVKEEGVTHEGEEGSGFVIATTDGQGI